jgi:sec-independent protein translocase protein TatB
MGTPPIIEVANLGMADSLILMVMALVVFGPRRLPQIGRQIGKLMYEFRKASNDFKFQMEEELRASEEADKRKKDEERQRLIALAAPPPAAPAATALAETGGVVETAADAAKAEETYPRIMPPSTGTPVAAARPNGRPAYAPGESPDGGDSSDAEAAVDPEAPAAAIEENPTPMTEQAAHHA